MINYIEPSFYLFGMEIRWYAICILIGVLIAVIAGVREGKKIGIPSDYIYTGVVIVLPCSILGARLWWDLFNLNQIHSFIDIFAIWDGGLAIQGGVLAALLSIYIYCRVRKFSFYHILDVVAPGFLIGQICGRWGNFCNHELYGPVVKNVELFKTLLPSFITENMYIDGFYRHPTFLYESLLNLVGLILMLVARRKLKKLESGDLIGFYLVWYGIVRIPIELLRSKSGIDEILMVGNAPMSIIISVIFILCGVGVLILKRFVGPRVNYRELLLTIKKNRYDTILFDLDGTLTDPKVGITKSVQYALQALGIEEPDLDKLEPFIGPPLKDSFMEFYGFNHEQTEIAVEKYRERFVVTGIFENEIYAGIAQMLANLHCAGKKLAIASSKPTVLVERILEHFAIQAYFDVVVGSEMDGTRSRKEEVVEEALRRLVPQIFVNPSERSAEESSIQQINKKALRKSIAMVGDRKFDIEGAKAFGLTGIGVAFGYAQEGELEQAGADYIVETVAELERLLMK